MSSEYYFEKWKKTLARLQKLVDEDLDYQETKAHDKQLCLAVQRLSGVLGEYIAVYNDAVECCRHNLQVQKTMYIERVASAVAARIIELKHQLSKLESSNYQMLAGGLNRYKLTPQDAEFSDIPHKIERPENVQAMIVNVMKKAKEEIERLAKEKDEPVKETAEAQNIWWDEASVNTEDVFDVYGGAHVEKPSEETVKRKELLAIIGAQEKSRQVIQYLTQQKLKREMWEKELLGELKPPLRKEIREKAAKLIQTFMRAYFDIKRKRIENCKRDELLGLRMCNKQSDKERKKSEEITLHNEQLRKKYDREWKVFCKQLKQKYLQKKRDDIAEDYRDEIRAWFQRWFDEVQFFYDIPRDNKGGSILILKEEVPSPDEWLEQYKAYVIQQKANKNKSAMELKFEKQAAKKEAMMAKKEQLMKKKMEEAILRKAMKNPNLHPGYHYPESKKIHNIIEAIKNYRKVWDDLDASKTLDVKEKYVKAIDNSNAWAEVKIAIRKSVDEYMRNELKLLKKALKADYERNGEQMPEAMKETGKKTRKKKRVKAVLSEHIAERMEHLAVAGLLVEYPKTLLKDFLGDPNFAGDDFRCMYKPALPYNGDTRNVWWERCSELVHGFHRLLLVGPKGSGKTTLVHAMATINNALLFELDPAQFQGELESTAHIEQLVNSIASCARAAQPSVVYIKHVHRVFYRKVPPEDAHLNMSLIKSFPIKKLFKKMQNWDNITIVGSCVDPWLAKASTMLQQFPNVMLMPNMTYSTTVQLLKDWVLDYKTIPPELDVSNLAYMLQGYSFGYLKQKLQEFMSAERIIKIAGKGLTPEEVHEYILQDDNETKIEYENYQSWYADNTSWGQKERQHIKQQKEFKEVLEKFEQKTQKKKKSESGVSSYSSLKP